MNHGIIIHPEDFDDLVSMDAMEAGHIVQNMIKTFRGESVVPFADRYLTRVSNDMCGRVLRDKELSEKRSRVGKLGGGQFGNTNAKQAKDEQKTSKKRAKTNSNTKTNTNTKTNINKRPYGEFQNVYLTDEEYEKVKSNGWLDLLEELSAYLDSKGDKYKNHYSALVSWNARRKKESGTIPFKPKEKQYQQLTKTEYDMDALERKLIKN